MNKYTIVYSTGIGTCYTYATAESPKDAIKCTGLRSSDVISVLNERGTRVYTNTNNN